MILQGTVEDIRFRNESNGYTVALLDTEDGLVTIVGNAAIINLEESVEVEGDWIYHDTYGEQLSFTSIRTVVPSSLKGIENYLASGLIPHIGPKTAEKIVERFGLDSLEIIQYNPERLKEISGIGDKKLESIVGAYSEQREIRDIMVYLQEYGISVSYGLKIYKRYGQETIAVINENPYKLSEDIFGIGFKIADKIAHNMGVSRDSIYRVEAGIRFVILEAAGDGNCYLPEEILINKARGILDVDKETVEEGLRNLAIKGTIHMVRDGEENPIYYSAYHQAENNVSRKLIELSGLKVKEGEIDLQGKIKEIEEETGIEFAEKQSLALKESIENGLLVITGGPGTGKTTIINGIIKLCESMNLSVSLAAPTGRAAKRMTETTGKEAKTIHRLLEYSFMEDDSEMAFGKDEETPIDSDMVIIDEASMIDILLMNSLLKAINPASRLVLVGDIDQLPSVGPGNVLRDIIDSRLVKVVTLDQIFRQSQASMIVVNAHRINHGESPMLNEEDKDFFFINKGSQGEIGETIIELIRERLPNYYGFDSLKDIQVLTPMKKGEVGTNALNKSIQAALNPESPEKEEKKMGDQIFRVGDKVMQIRNNYSTEWTRHFNGMVLERGEGVFNGDLGYIKSMDREGSSLRVLFDDDKEVEYDFTNLDELIHAYSTTVHKSQGSEFPVIVMPITWGPPMLLTRNLLYTAITRARKLVVLVGQQRYFHTMIDNNRITKRYSALDRKIRDYVALFEE